MSHALNRPPWRHIAAVTWRPMTDAEWDRLKPFVAALHPGPGRPIDPRRALDACFHAACMPCPWRDLPPIYGKPDSVSRLFRRWAHAGLWSRLLAFIARERTGMRAVQYYICRAFRRAWRIQGLAGIILARRLRLATALRAPPICLPDPDLSDDLHARVIRPMAPRLPTLRREVPLWHIRWWKLLYRWMIGLGRITRAMAYR